MKRSAWTSVVVVAVCALALGACGKGTDGGGGAVTDQARTSAGTAAETTLLSTSGQAQDAATLGQFGQALGEQLSAGDYGSIDISGLPTPVHAAGLHAPGRPTAPALRFGHPASRADGMGPTTGCVSPDPDSGASQARFDSFGENGCTANDHVEVTYLNGDEVSYSFTDTSVTMVVTGGDYAGTRITFTFTLQDGTQDSSTIQINGVLLYSGAPAPEHIQFQSTFHVLSLDGSAEFSLTGNSTDFIAARQVTSDLHLSERDTGGGNSGSVDIEWTGNATITHLDGNGAPTDDGKVEWRAFSLSERFSSATNSLQVSASGEVLFEGAVVGQVISDGTQVKIQWSDGVTTPFDFSVFFSSFVL